MEQTNLNTDGSLHVVVVLGHLQYLCTQVSASPDDRRAIGRAAPDVSPPGPLLLAAPRTARVGAYLHRHRRGTAVAAAVSMLVVSAGTGWMLGVRAEQGDPASMPPRLEVGAARAGLSAGSPQSTAAQSQALSAASPTSAVPTPQPANTTPPLPVAGAAVVTGVQAPQPVGATPLPPQAPIPAAKAVAVPAPAAPIAAPGPQALQPLNATPPLPVATALAARTTLGLPPAAPMPAAGMPALQPVGTAPTLPVVAAAPAPVPAPASAAAVASPLASTTPAPVPSGSTAQRKGPAAPLPVTTALAPAAAPAVKPPPPNAAEKKRGKVERNAQETTHVVMDEVPPAKRSEGPRAAVASAAAATLAPAVPVVRPMRLLAAPSSEWIVVSDPKSNLPKRVALGGRLPSGAKLVSVDTGKGVAVTDRGTLTLE